MNFINKTLLLLVLAAYGSAAKAIDITVVFSGGLTASQESVFTSAELYWESVLVGYQPGISIAGPTIDASGVAIDGAGGILGQAGPQYGVVQGGYVLTTDGIMQFDTADIANLEAAGVFDEVIIHEMAHVLGFGTLWELNGVYDPVNSPGEYLGLSGIEAYQNEFDPLATFVPVELDGGPGTANAHWDETWAGGANELMTGYLNTPTFISDTTLASFEDIGFLVVSIPGTLGLMLLGMLGLGGRWLSHAT